MRDTLHRLGRKVASSLIMAAIVLQLVPTAQMQTATISVASNIRSTATSARLSFNVPSSFGSDYTIRIFGDNLSAADDAALKQVNAGFYGLPKGLGKGVKDVTFNVPSGGKEYSLRYIAAKATDGNWTKDSWTGWSDLTPFAYGLKVSGATSTVAVTVPAMGTISLASNTKYDTNASQLNFNIPSSFGTNYSIRIFPDQAISASELTTLNSLNFGNISSPHGWGKGANGLLVRVPTGKEYTFKAIAVASTSGNWGDDSDYSTNWKDISNWVTGIKVSAIATTTVSGTVPAVTSATATNITNGIRVVVNHNGNTSNKYPLLFGLREISNGQETAFIGDIRIDPANSYIKSTANNSMTIELPATVPFYNKDTNSNGIYTFKNGQSYRFWVMMTDSNYNYPSTYSFSKPEVTYSNGSTTTTTTTTTTASLPKVTNVQGYARSDGGMHFDLTHNGTQGGTFNTLIGVHQIVNGQDSLLGDIRINPSVNNAIKSTGSSAVSVDLPVINSAVKAGVATSDVKFEQGKTYRFYIGFVDANWNLPSGVGFYVAPDYTFTSTPAASTALALQGTAKVSDTVTKITFNVPSSFGSTYSLRVLGDGISDADIATLSQLNPNVFNTPRGLGKGVNEYLFVTPAGKTFKLRAIAVAATDNDWTKNSDWNTGWKDISNWVNGITVGGGTSSTSIPTVTNAAPANAANGAISMTLTHNGNNSNRYNMLVGVRDTTSGENYLGDILINQNSALIKSTANNSQVIEIPSSISGVLYGAPVTINFQNGHNYTLWTAFTDSNFNRPSGVDWIKPVLAYKLGTTSTTPVATATMQVVRQDKMMLPRTSFTIGGVQYERIDEINSSAYNTNDPASTAAYPCSIDGNQVVIGRLNDTVPNQVSATGFLWGVTGNRQNRALVTIASGSSDSSFGANQSTYSVDLDSGKARITLPGNDAYYRVNISPVFNVVSNTNFSSTYFGPTMNASCIVKTNGVAATTGTTSPSTTGALPALVSATASNGSNGNIKINLSHNGNTSNKYNILVGVRPLTGTTEGDLIGDLHIDSGSPYITSTSFNGMTLEFPPSMGGFLSGTPKAVEIQNSKKYSFWVIITDANFNWPAGTNFVKTSLDYVSSTTTNTTVSAPSVPTNVTLRQDQNSLIANWSTTPGMLYTVILYQKTSSGQTELRRFNNLQLAPASFDGSLIGINQGTKLIASVTAVNSAGDTSAATTSSEITYGSASGSSSTTTYTPPAGAPATPLVTLTTGQGQMTASWMSSVGATSYDLSLMEKTSSGDRLVRKFEGLIIGPAGFDANSLGMTQNFQYKAVLTAKNAAGASAPGESAWVTYTGSSSSTGTQTVGGTTGTQTIGGTTGSSTGTQTIGALTTDNFNTATASTTNASSALSAKVVDTNATDRLYRFSWTAINDPYFTNYRLYVRKKENNPQDWQYAASYGANKDLNYTVPGLVDGTVYQARITAQYAPYTTSGSVSTMYKEIAPIIDFTTEPVRNNSGGGFTTQSVDTSTADNTPQANLIRVDGGSGNATTSQGVTTVRAVNLLAQVSQNTTKCEIREDAFNWQEVTCVPDNQNHTIAYTLQRQTEGEAKIQLRASNAAGASNLSVERTITYTTTAPSLTVTGVPTDWRSTTVNGIEARCASGTTCGQVSMVATNSITANQSCSDVPATQYMTVCNESNNFCKNVYFASQSGTNPTYICAKADSTTGLTGYSVKQELKTDTVTPAPVFSFTDLAATTGSNASYYTKNNTVNVRLDDMTVGASGIASCTMTGDITGTVACPAKGQTVTVTLTSGNALKSVGMLVKNGANATNTVRTFIMKDDVAPAFTDASNIAAYDKNTNGTVKIKPALVTDDNLDRIELTFASSQANFALPSTVLASVYAGATVNGNTIILKTAAGSNQLDSTLMTTGLSLQNLPVDNNGTAYAYTITQKGYDKAGNETPGSKQLQFNLKDTTNTTTTTTGQITVSGGTLTIPASVNTTLIRSDLTFSASPVYYTITKNGTESSKVLYNGYIYLDTGSYTGITVKFYDAQGNQIGTTYGPFTTTVTLNGATASFATAEVYRTKATTFDLNVSSILSDADSVSYKVLNGSTELKTGDRQKAQYGQLLSIPGLTLTPNSQNDFYVVLKENNDKESAFKRTVIQDSAAPKVADVQANIVDVSKPKWSFKVADEAGSAVTAVKAHLTDLTTGEQRPVIQLNPTTAGQYDVTYSDLQMRPGHEYVLDIHTEDELGNAADVQTSTPLIRPKTQRDTIDMLQKAITVDSSVVNTDNILVTLGSTLGQYVSQLPRGKQAIFGDILTAGKSSRTNQSMSRLPVGAYQTTVQTVGAATQKTQTVTGFTVDPYYADASADLNGDGLVGLSDEVLFNLGKDSGKYPTTDSDINNLRSAIQQKLTLAKQANITDYLKR